MDEKEGEAEFDLVLTNKEVRSTFRQMIGGWFSRFASSYNDFVKAMLLGDKKAMNAYMNKVALATFSYFDTGKGASKYTEPEQCEADASHFYHGFVLGLIVDLAGRHTVTSNRESGFGRYDVLLEPCRNKEGGISGNAADDYIIMGFKVHELSEKKRWRIQWREPWRKLNVCAMPQPWKRKGFRQSGSGVMGLPLRGRGF